MYSTINYKLNSGLICKNISHTTIIGTDLSIVELLEHSKALVQCFLEFLRIRVEFDLDIDIRFRGVVDERHKLCADGFLQK